MSESGPRVAVVDDERHLRDLLEIGLAQQGFTVRVAADGQEALTLVRDWSPDCIVLDVMMPKIDGLSLVPMLRRLTEVPIVMLSARGEVEDRIDGLRSGADDYLTKPFDIGELVARLHSALRRPNLARVEHLRFADLQVDLGARLVRRGERRVTLSTREFDLLVALMRYPYRVLSRDQLLDTVWGADREVSPATVETYISYVRAKIDLPHEQRLIHTIRGVGYSLRDT